MDIYSCFQIPFGVGVWARSHKFDRTSVKLTQMLLQLRVIEKKQQELDAAREKTETTLREAVTEAQAKLKESDAA